MCIICLDFQKGRLTTKEARRALGEMAVTLDKRHVAEIEASLAKAERDANAGASAASTSASCGTNRKSPSKP